MCQYFRSIAFQVGMDCLISVSYESSIIDDATMKFEN